MDKVTALSYPPGICGYLETDSPASAAEPPSGRTAEKVHAAITKTCSDQAVWRCWQPESGLLMFFSNIQTTGVWEPPKKKKKKSKQRGMQPRGTRPMIATWNLKRCMYPTCACHVGQAGWCVISCRVNYARVFTSYSSHICTSVRSS